MILNHPGLMLRESANHYKTKLLIGQLADNHLVSLAEEIDYKLYVAFEMQFKALWVEKDTTKPRLYTGDVVILLMDKYHDNIPLGNIIEGTSWETAQDGADLMMNIEVDGYIGHGSVIRKANNRLRDEELKKLDIFVHRMPLQSVKQREEWQAETTEEIINFYHKCIRDKKAWLKNNNLQQLQ